MSHGRTRGSRRLATCVVASLVAVLAVVWPVGQNAEASSIAPFAARYTSNDNGSIAVFGNSLMTCPAADGECAATRAGRTTKNNNTFPMVHVDVDDVPSTYSSSRATVSLPDGGEVKWAGLYWGARLGSGAGGSAATGDGRTMKLAVPGSSAYRTVTADRLFGPSPTSDRAYQSVADVTDVVRAAGPGAYTGADVPAATGEDRYSGWSLVVVYRAPSLPLRNLTVFDGLADVGRDDPQTVSISGFRTPVTGTVNARIGLVAYEGDRGSTGDRAILRDASNPDGTLLSTPLSPGTNFFNGTNDDNGQVVTARTPADVNMLGFDIKNFDGPGILGNGSTSARIDLASTSERYFPGVVTTAIDVFAPDFSPSTKTVTNLTGGTPAAVGDRLRYAVTFVNGGQDPAVNTSVVDRLPPGTAYVPGSLSVPAGVTGRYDPTARAVLVQPGNFPIGRSVPFTFDVDVGPTAADTTVSNSATITYDGATVPELKALTFATNAAALAVAPSANLSVTKTSTPDPVRAGEPVSSTITVRNAGPSPASDVVVVDDLPEGLGAVTATATGGTCEVAARAVTCRLGTLAVGGTATVTVRATVAAGSLAVSVTDLARVTSPTPDPNPSNNTSAATSRVERAADVSVTKVATPSTVSPGEAVTYVLTATNAGPSTATDVALTDTVGSSSVRLTGATAPGATCAFADGSARCTLPALAPGASVRMTVSALARPDAAPGAVDNTASVSTATPDPVAANDVATGMVTVGPARPGLVVEKRAVAAGDVVAGRSVVRYVVPVRNDGPSDAAATTVTDTLPAGFTVDTATSDRGACTVDPAASGDAVTCPIGPLLAPSGGRPGPVASIEVVASVSADVAPGTYPNTATATTAGVPPVASDPAPVTVVARADVTVTKSFPEGTTDTEIVPGQSKTYRVRVTNDGPSVAEDVTVTDVLPDGLTATAFRVVSIAPPTGGTPTCGTAPATCDLGSLPPGTVVELEIDVAIAPDLVIPPEGVPNTARVTTSTTDPSPDNDESVFIANGTAQADVSVRKLAPTVPPVAGRNASYVLEVVNFGSSNATGLVVTDVLPPDTRFVRYFEPTGDPEVPGLCSGDGGSPETVTCDFGSLLDPAVGGFPPFVGTRIGIEIALDPAIPEGTLLSNTATVTTSSEDPNPGNNTSTFEVPVRTETNLTIRKLMAELDANGNVVREVPYPDALQMPAGYAVAFVLSVENRGPSAAAGVAVVDAFEPESSNFETTTCEVLNGEVVCPYTNDATGDLLLPGQSFQPQIIFIPDGGTPQGTYLNRARVTSSTPETDPGDNADQRTVEVVAPVADLVVDKTALSSPLLAGGGFTYQVAVSAGRIDIAEGVLRLSSDAQEVVVTDTLPAGLTPSSASSSQGTCTVTGQDVRCALGTIESTNTPDPVAPAIVTISGTVAPDVAGDSVTNAATATASTPLVGGADEVVDRVETPVERSANLSVTKTAAAPSLAAGGGTTFTITVTNSGPSVATGVQVTDLLPAPLLLDAAGTDSACAAGDDGLSCGLGTIGVGETRTVVVAATVPPDATPAGITNTASVTSQVPDPEDADDSASVDVEVVRQANLSVTKVAAAEGVQLGGTIAYTLAVANNGPSDASDVVLTETIPDGTTLESLPDGCSGSGPVTCALGDLPAGTTRVLDLVLAVPEGLAPGPLTNTASITSPTEDPDPSDNEATAVVEAIAVSDVVLDKRVVTSPAGAGQPVVFTLTVTNKGPTVAPAPSLSDALPDGTRFVSFTAPGGTCQLDQAEDVRAASCALAPLAVGESVTATLTLDADPGLRSITNTAYAGSGGLDETPADNEDTVEVDLLPPLTELTPTPTPTAPTPTEPSTPPGPGKSGGPGQGGGGRPLASTGGPLLLLVVLGASLTLAGATLRLAARRRPSRATGGGAGPRT